MKGNTDKCNLLLKKTDKIQLEADDSLIRNSSWTENFYWMRFLTPSLISAV